jgi:cold shock CspA family protein
MENESQQIQVDPRNIHYTKRSMPPCPYKQCATPPRCRVSWATPWQETYLAQTHFRKTETTRNHSHQNVLVTQTQVKPSRSNKLLTYKTILKPIWTWNTTLGYGFHFQQRNPRTLPIESFAHDSAVQCSGMCRIWLSKGISYHQSAAITLSTVPASVNTQMTY